MSTPASTHPTFAHQWFDEVWNQRRLHRISELSTPDCALHSISAQGPTKIGPAEFEEFAKALCGSFDDIRIDVDETHETGDIVISRWTARMKHTRPFQGIPPTNREAKVKGISIMQVSDGKMIEGWENWDVLGLYRQLGAVLAIKDEAGNLRPVES